MQGVTKGRRTLALSLVVGLIGLVGAASASAAVQVGETFTPPMGDAGEFTTVQSGSPGGQYAMPSAGVVTSWSYRSAASFLNPIKLKIARPAGGTNFTIVGEDGPNPAPAANTLYTFPARIAVQAGDVLGLRIPPPGVRFFRETAGGYVEHLVAGDPPPGTTTAFTSTSSVVQLDVSAILEPDCDNDGFGDETQDAVVDCVAPETQITKGPKAKTRKKKATFEFTSSEPGSTFECSLDGGPFAACTSPDTVKVKKGKHSFAVRAKDPAGNVDGSPATDDWKVKKKKRK
jgi:hypothetical protein